MFQFGPLDQGWWPDGLYTAPTDEALVYDIQKTKYLGFNMIRKHIKVEPARWYTHCDQLGIIVWQDMPSGDRNPDVYKRQQGGCSGCCDFISGNRQPQGYPYFREWRKSGLVC